MGHAITTVSIVEFEKHRNLPGTLKVLAECCDPNLGGRNIDKLLSDYFADKFRANGLLPDDTLKKRLKLEKAAAKSKTILSGGQEALFTAEALDDGEDAEGKITVGEYETLCKGLQDRLRALLSQAIDDSGRAKGSIRSVEVVGGCSPIPWVLRCVEEVFGKEASRTLLLDEAVARGCTLRAAMMKPEPPFAFVIKEKNRSHAAAEYLHSSKREVFAIMEKEMVAADNLLWGKREAKNQLEKRVYSLKKRSENDEFGLRCGDLAQLCAQGVRGLGVPAELWHCGTGRTSQTV